jgi:hypothetical protein
MAQFLEDLAVGTMGGALQWGIFVGSEPTDPAAHADAITLYDTGGDEPDTDEQDVRPTFQVRVRASAYLAGISKIEQIRDALIDPATIVVGGVTYVGVEESSEIAHIGRDDSDRDLLVANFRTRKER